MGKGKPDKNVSIVNLKHDGCLICDPFGYVQGDEKQIKYINFEGMSFVEVREIVKTFSTCPSWKVVLLQSRHRIKSWYCWT